MTGFEAARSILILRFLKRDIENAYLKVLSAAAEELPALSQFFVEAVETLAFACNSRVIEGATLNFVEGYLLQECHGLQSRQDAIGSYWRANRDASPDAFCEIKRVVATTGEVTQ